jgi:nucleotide-binding universal stress UspA family protein
MLHARRPKAPADVASTDDDAAARAPTGPVLFAYDGSELAKLAIEQAGRQLQRGREALIVCVWQPADVGFVPAGGQHFDAADAAEVRKAAEETAAAGAALAEAAGFRPLSVAIEGAPIWKGIVKVAEEREASLIVLGSHRRSGVVGHLLGSVSAAVVAHAASSVLIVPQRS